MTEITPDMVFEQTMKLLKVNKEDEAIGISKTVD
jgi:hypothetical protein